MTHRGDQSKERETYWIAEGNMDRLHKALKRMNKRADKIGCPHVTVISHGTKEVHDPVQVAYLADYLQRPVSAADLLNIPLIKLVEVEIVGEGPKIEGWKFVGTLDHYTIPGKVIVNTVPGEAVPEQYFNVEPSCDHCNKIRRRIETFVLEGIDENEGQWQAVGRNCLKDFFGHDPSAVARWLTRVMVFVASLDDEEEWRGCGGGRYEHYYDSIKVLSNTVACIRTFGWVARSAQDDENVATANHVSYIMNPSWNSQERDAKKLFIAKIKFDDEADTKEAEDAVAWLKTKEPNNEYMHNLKLLENEDSIPSKMFGYWCSLIAAYQREMDRLERAKRTKKLNEYLGEIKDRIVIEVKCVGIQYIDGAYGAVCIHRMLDTDGRSVIWFANSDAKMVKGASYKIRATVKKHSEYNDWKQTQVSRLVVVEKTKDVEDE